MKVIGTCEVCGDDTCYDILNRTFNHDGLLHILNGKEQDIIINMCQSCAEEVLDYVKQLQKENGML